MQRLEELGLADFVAMLLVETLDSIVAAHTSQEDRLRALQEASAQTVEQFAAALDPAIVEQAFPVEEGQDVPEQELLQQFGVTLGDDDAVGGKLTATGVQTILAGVRLHMAGQQLESVKRVAEQGIPRVRVDGGVLRSKLTFSAVKNVEEEEEPVLRIPERPTYINTLQAGILDAITKTRLHVRPAVAKDDDQQETTTLYGEVEIHFHTE